MKAVVFGGSGFLGSHIADELTKRNYDVTIFDVNASSYLQNGQRMVTGDILDYQLIDSIIAGADVVYNFAALANIDATNPIETFRTNVMGALYVLTSCCHHNVKRFVYASSIYVYSGYGSFYASSKRACEDIIENFESEYGLPYTILRYGSIYGPRANKFNWVYKAIKQALFENRITRKGDGEELREYIHVKDAATLSVDILADEYQNQCINITGNQQMRIKDLHIMIKEILNKDIKLEYIPATDWKSHYMITPYTFKPQKAQKLTLNKYHDMGSGLLECIEEIHNATQS